MGTDDGHGLLQGTLAQLEEATFRVDDARPRGPLLRGLSTAEVARRSQRPVSDEAIAPEACGYALRAWSPRKRSMPTEHKCGEP